MGDWLPKHGGFEKECPVCRAFFIGRKNRKYCSAACKSRCNNDLAKERRDEELAIGGSLVSNARILKGLLDVQPLSEQTKVELSELLTRGFDRNSPYRRVSIDGTDWMLIDNIRYRVDENKQVHIMKNEEENG